MEDCLLDITEIVFMLMKKFLNLNSYNKTHFRHLLSKISEVPDQMEDYIDLFYTSL